MNKVVVHKYIFYIGKKGIKAYRIKNKTEYEIIRYKGDNICRDRDLKAYFKWFEKVASITKDDRIDFCFLSEIPIELPIINHGQSEKSSWRRENIIEFCEKEIGEDNYEILVDDNVQFVSQVSNLVNKAKIQQLYLKCIPKFSIENKEPEKEDSEETSILNRYFMDMLKDI